MSQERTPEDMRRFVDTYRTSVEKRSLMYGGDLNGVEAVWSVINTMTNFLEGEDVFNADDIGFSAYETIAARYKCGNWAISTKVREELGETAEAASELIRRLKEVDDLRAELRDKQKTCSK